MALRFNSPTADKYEGSFRIAKYSDTTGVIVSPAEGQLSLLT